jgi:hypothetical protein
VAVSIVPHPRDIVDTIVKELNLVPGAASTAQPVRP